MRKIQLIGTVIALALPVIYLVSNTKEPFEKTVSKTAPHSPTAEDWKQWGGKDRDFKSGIQVPPSSTPVQVWRKSIGAGYSAIVTDGDYAVVCFKKDNREVVDKLSLADGKSVWISKFETDYDWPNEKYDGPISTPVVVGERIVTVGKDGTVRCLDLSDGSLNWSHRLKDSGTSVPQSGYGSSPLVYEDFVIVSALGNASSEETEYYDEQGRNGNVPGAVALNINTGKVEWKSQSFRLSHSSPILVEMFNRRLVVFHGMFELLAIDPRTGKIQWRHLLRRLAADNVAFTPVWDAKRNQIIVSHGYCDQGTQAIGVKLENDRWEVARRWKVPKLRINHTNAILIDSHLIGSNRIPNTLLFKLDVADGQVVSRSRGFDKANFVGAGDQCLMLESNGYLSILNPDSLAVTGRTQLMLNRTWTVPTPVKNGFLVRDNSNIKMFEWTVSK